MFEAAGKTTGGPVQPLLTWFAGLDASYGTQAEALMQQAEEAAPSLRAWCTTPQGGPWHCEGPVLADHICRILIGLRAVEGGAALADIEEFAREKDLVLDIAALQATLRTHVPLLAVFALTHDAAKPVALSFDAPVGSRGEAEGFVARKKDAPHPASQAERSHYDKLFRAYHAAHPERDVIQTMTGFYDAYGIMTHYLEHESLAVAPAFEPVRHAMLALFGLPHAHSKMLTELIRYHLDVLHFFGTKPEAKKYEVMAARAGKAGVNTDLFLDLMIAAAFLDAVVGGVVSRDGKATAQTELVVNMLRAEREVMPERHARREEQAASGKKQAYKDALAKAGLDGESVFTLLGTPIGPERGVVMGHVASAIKDPAYRLDVGAQTAELSHRIAQARSLLTALRSEY